MAIVVSTGFGLAQLDLGTSNSIVSRATVLVTLTNGTREKLEALTVEKLYADKRLVGELET